MPSPHCGVAGLALAGLLCACTPNNASAPAQAAPGAATTPRAVHVTTVAEETWERSVAATGELAPMEQVVVATKVPGRLATLKADLGQRVRRGEVLATLESRDYEFRQAQAAATLAGARAVLGLAEQGVGEYVTDESAAVKLALAELEQARLERERAQTLARDGVDSQARLDSAEASFRAAESRVQEARELVESRRALVMQREAELEIARAQLAETTLEAPFDGAIVARHSATGAYLAIGDGVLELVRLDPLRLALSVPERDAGLLQVGQRVRAEIEGVERELEGGLVRLSPVLSERSRALRVEAEFANPDGSLRPGAFARARIVIDPTSRTLTVPAAALLEFAGIDKVFLVKDGRAEERRVTLGRRGDGRAEVLEGLQAGDVVVLEPGNLTTGTAVRAE